MQVLAASCEELRARTGNPPLVVQTVLYLVTVVTRIKASINGSSSVIESVKSLALTLVKVKHSIMMRPKAQLLIKYYKLQSTCYDLYIDIESANNHWFRHVNFDWGSNDTSI
jgi:hypothetical protein